MLMLVNSMYSEIIMAVPESAGQNFSYHQLNEKKNPQITGAGYIRHDDDSGAGYIRHDDDSAFTKILISILTSVFFFPIKAHHRQTQ